MDVFENLYLELSNIVRDKQLTQENIIDVLIKFMQATETYRELSGVQKKAIVITVLSRFIDETMAYTETTTQLKLFVHFTLPTLIDTIINIDKNHIGIKTKNWAKGLFGCCN